MPRRLSLLLGGLLCCAYLLTSGGYLDNPNARSSFLLARNLVVSGHWAMVEPSGLDHMFERDGPDGKRYSKSAPLQPLLFLPFVALLAAGDMSGHGDFVLSLLNAPFTAASAAILACLAWDLTASVQVGIALGLIYGLGTYAWTYATLSYVEPVLSLFVLVALWALHRGSRQPRWNSIAGLAFGLAALSKYHGLLYATGLVRAVLGKRRAWMAVLPVAAAIACIGAYDYHRFGSIFETGYVWPEYARVRHGPWFGAAVLAASPGKSLLLYAPPLLPALLAWREFHAQHRDVARDLLWTGAFVTIYLVTVRPLAGDWSPGPRYHLPLVAPLLLPLCTWLGAWRSIPAWKRRLVAWTLALGVLVQVANVAVSYVDVLTYFQVVHGDRPWGFWHLAPAYAPVLWQARFAVAVTLAMLHGAPVPATGVWSIADPGRDVASLNFWFCNGIITPLWTWILVAALVAGIVTCSTGLATQAGWTRARRRRSAGDA